MFVTDLTTPLLAKYLGVTPRKIIYLTDHGALQAIPSSIGGGHSSKRLYAADYLPQAAVVGEIAKFKIPVFHIANWSRHMSKLVVNGDRESGKSAEWYKAALTGSPDTYIILGAPMMIISEMGEWFSWEETKMMTKIMQSNHSAILINVGAVIRRLQT
jgi:hypothetical protein